MGKDTKVLPSSSSSGMQGLLLRITPSTGRTEPNSILKTETEIVEGIWHDTAISRRVSGNYQLGKCMVVRHGGIALTLWLGPESSAQGGGIALVIYNRETDRSHGVRTSSTVLEPINFPRKSWIYVAIEEDTYSFYAIFYSEWIEDTNLQPLYKSGSCSFVDNAFNYFKNGRHDTDYLRNIWEFVVCALRNSLNDKNRVNEVSGRWEVCNASLRFSGQTMVVD
ncbi:hypothetical protein BC332_23906 [Capsicum chinense]|nr:hypothetical protein BC332_23906 [Capsicum chinense]